MIACLRRRLVIVGLMPWREVDSTHRTQIILLLLMSIVLLNDGLLLLRLDDS